MEKKRIERLYALLKRAKHEKDNGYRCRGILPLENAME